MADFLTPEQRSKRMSLIRGKDTVPERAMARLLRRAGIKYRSQARLPGTPDFRIIGSRAVVFVDGDFWHGRDFDSWRHKLAPFWLAKITRNRERDTRVEDRKSTRLNSSH